MSLSSKFELGITFGMERPPEVAPAAPLGRQIGRTIFARKGLQQNF
jgi:hypothetical protein